MKEMPKDSSKISDSVGQKGAWNPLRDGNQNALVKNQLLRIAEVSALTTLAKSTINLWESTGRFPKSIALSPTIKVWTLESIANWLDSARS